MGIQVNTTRKFPSLSCENTIKKTIFKKKKKEHYKKLVRIIKMWRNNSCTVGGNAS
jgi:hypothetical protein